MVKEVIKSLHINKSSQIIDATLGTGGHSQEIINMGGKVLGIERDPKILKIAKDRLKETGTFVLGNFTDLDKIARENNFNKVTGILFDLGVSNIHLKEDDRGFSFSDSSQLLDMRLDPNSQGVKASDLLNVLDKTQLTNLFAKVVNFTNARKIAERIVNARPIATVGELILCLEDLPHKRNLNPATLPMLALRIAVNSELENLEEVLPKAFNLLENDGRLLVITFHSGEERIVKDFFKGRGEVVLPSQDEIFNNQKSRSAKLYVLEKKL
jgi:16S rRNA (cytosine1402-N4)-methyltransferase